MSELMKKKVHNTFDLMETEDQELKEFSQSIGYTTFTTFIRDALRAVQANPSLLKPSHPDPSQGLQAQFATLWEQFAQASTKERDNVQSEIKTLHASFEKLNAKVDHLLSMQNVSKKKIKELSGKDTSEEVIFDE